MAPVPVAVQPRQPRGAPGLPPPARGFEPAARRATCCCSSRCSTGLGYGNDARVRAAVGYEMRCEVADGDPPLADSELEAARRPEPARGRRGMRRGDRRLGRRRRGHGGDPRRGRARGRGAGGGPVHGPAHLPRRAAGRARGALPRRRADDRRGPPGDPDAGRPGRRRDDGDQLGHLLPGAGGGARRLASRARDRVGHRSGRPTTRRPRRCSTCARSIPSGWAETASSCARAPRRWASATTRCAATPARCSPVQLVPAGLPAGRQAGHARLLPAARRRGRGAGAGRGRGSAGRLRARRRGHGARLLGAAPTGTRSRAVHELRARRAVVLAGGAFGTPELLLRSGFRSPSGQLGRNLRIHPACWVGARFAEEVRGWDGVMQSYAVDEWEDRGILLEATFTPLAFGAQWLPGTGVEHAGAGARLRPDRLDRRPPLRSVGGAGGAGRATARCASPTASRTTTPLGSCFGIARAAELFYAAGAREVYPQIAGIPTIPKDRIADLEASPPARARLRLEAFHPMGTARMDADPGARRGRHRRRGPRRRGPLRGRRQPAAELDRRQPDDDHHRDGLPGRAAGSRTRLN